MGMYIIPYPNDMWYYQALNYFYFVCVCVQSHLFTVLICIFVNTSEVEDLFMFISYLDFLFVKYLPKSF